jgi:uncharacterized protein YjfI (DUF2170 family)
VPDWCVTIWGEVSNEVIVGKDACLFKAIHAFGDFDIYIVFMDEWGDVVMIDEFIWDEVDWTFHVLRGG